MVVVKKKPASSTSTKPSKKQKTKGAKDDDKDKGAKDDDKDKEEEGEEEEKEDDVEEDEAEAPQGPKREKCQCVIDLLPEEAHPDDELSLTAKSHKKTKDVRP